MEKIVKAGLRDCTVNLDGSECAVRFDTCFRAFAVRNDSGADVFISKSSGIVPDADGIMCVRSGGSTVFAHNDLDKNAVYLLGTGKVMVHGQQDSNNPFNYAPTIVGGVQASGNPVQLDGLQEGIPFSEMAVSGKNLMPFPYYDGNSKTHNGITFTVNADGTITANGTATASAIFYISTNYTIKKGIYTLSGCPKSDSNTNYILQFATGDWSFKVSDFGNGATTQIDNDINLQIFRIAISNGVVCDNLVFRPQLELGDTPTEYEPPITGRELTVNVSGKNLMKYPYFDTNKTVNGVTYTVNGDGTITMNGTSTDKSYFYFTHDVSKKIYPAGKYTISGMPKNSIIDLRVLNIDDSTVIANDIGNSASFVLTKPAPLRIYLYFGAGKTFDNVTIYPQLELGDTTTPYEPYHGAEYTITPTSNPYVIPNDIRQVDGLNVVSVSEGEISVTGARKNAAVKKIWDKLDELTTAIIVSNGETIE